jgi:hypothetical protein
MAREVHKGAASIEGVEATLWRVIFQLSIRMCYYTAIVKENIWILL